MAAAAAAAAPTATPSSFWSTKLHENSKPSTSSLSFNSPFSFSFSLSSFKPKRAFKLKSVEEQEKAVTSEEALKKDLTKPCELYVCNLPRSCDIAGLLDLFKPYGIVHSVEVCRDPATGISRGCAFVTVNSVPEARTAITALDGSDLGGREIRVKFSADMVPGRRNSEALTSAPKLGIIFESPHKAYVGNLAWSVKPEDLRAHFSRFGTVVSARMLYDTKGGRSRVYGFLSFSSADELRSAIESSGTDFRGRTLLVREVVKRE